MTWEKDQEGSHAQGHARTRRLTASLVVAPVSSPGAGVHAARAWALSLASMRWSRLSRSVRMNFQAAPCRLRPPNGSSRSTASHDDYYESIFPTGLPIGTCQDALDTACGLYLNDPTAWA
jgi:hypothetical protein